MGSDSVHYWLIRLVFQRSLACIYFVSFLVSFRQIVPLCGENGILPASLHLKRIRFRAAPTLFRINCSDSTLRSGALAGMILSLLALTGLPERQGFALSAAFWAGLWVLNLSFVNIGQQFYTYGFDWLLLETGFLAIFLGSSNTEPCIPLVWIFRYALFRVMFGNGTDKLRREPAWRDLSALNYHYETQPIPTPLSRTLHFFPEAFHRGCAMSVHVIELVVPFFFFAPSPYRVFAGAITILFQLAMALTGNFGWVNYLTMALALFCLDDRIFPEHFAAQIWKPTVLSPYPTAALVLLLIILIPRIIRPTLNLIPHEKFIPTRPDPFHIVNAYYLYSNILKTRHELVFEGTLETQPTDKTQWKQYEFKAKPGDPKVRPRFLAPYTHRLTSGLVRAGSNPGEWEHWTTRLVERLLRGDTRILSLLSSNPFPDRPPLWVRVSLYRYQFMPLLGSNGRWWRRKRIQEYLSAVSLQ